MTDSDCKSEPSGPAAIEPTQVIVTPIAPHQLARQSGRNLLSVAASVLQYDPTPLEQPRISIDFAEAAVPLRMLQSIHYFFQITEFRLSSDGWLRAWLVLWLRALMLVVIPTVIVGVAIWILVPVMIGTEHVFGSLAAIASYLKEFCGSLFIASLYILGTLFVLAAVIAFLPTIASLIEKKKSKK